MTGIFVGLLLSMACSPMLCQGQEMKVRPAYTPPTAHDRLETYLHAAFGRGALIRAASSGAFSDVTGAIPEFNREPDGLLERVGIRVTLNAARQSIKYGVSAWLNEDPEYYRCDCTRLLPRLRHALLSTITARRPDGSRTVAWGTLAGAYGSGMLEAWMLPPGYNVPGDGLRFGSGQIGLAFASGLAREFWPDIRRHFHKGKQERPNP